MCVFGVIDGTGESGMTAVESVLEVMEGTWRCGTTALKSAGIC